MLKELQFVKGAVAKKDFDPTLTHFLIRDGRVWGFNGTIGLSSPITCDLDIAPQGLPFLRALNACEGAVTLHLAKSGHLVVRSGSFRTNINCVAPEEHRALPPAGSFIELTGGLLDPLKKLEPFIGFDASRQWACGILFRGRSAYATNNIIFAEYWLGYEFPLEVNIPTQAIRELIRINEEPLGLQVCEDRLTFYYSEGRWLMTKLSALEWPNLERVFELTEKANYADAPEGLFDALDKVKPFTDDMGQVIFNGKCLSTTGDETGTSYDLASAPEQGKFNCDQLAALRNVARQLDFGQYPKPVPFRGERIRGVIAGLR
jgi:DNA polymerase III sliding clamp (beta) subunit (PCNA family)